MEVGGRRSPAVACWASCHWVAKQCAQKRPKTPSFHPMEVSMLTDNMTVM